MHEKLACASSNAIHQVGFCRPLVGGSLGVCRRMQRPTGRDVKGEQGTLSLDSKLQPTGYPPLRQPCSASFYPLVPNVVTQRKAATSRRA